MRFVPAALSVVSLCVILSPQHFTHAAPDPAPQPTVLVFSEFTHPRSLDPHKAGDVVSSRHTMHVYETLLEYAPFGEARLVPCLAASMPVYDAEKLTYTFTLRDDIYFADDDCFPEGKGRKVTAEDVVFSLMRLAFLPDSGGFWVIEGAIKGLDKLRDEALFSWDGKETDAGEPIMNKEWWDMFKFRAEGLKALDARTVQIMLNQPYPQLLYAITLSYGAVVPREAAEKVDLRTHPVGTGPYKLKDYGDDLIVYERNPRYRNVTLENVPEGDPLKRFEGARLPLTDVLRYQIMPETADSFRAFLEKKHAITGMDQQQFEEVIDPKAREAGKQGDGLLRDKYRKQGIHLREYLEPTLHYISFNMNDKTFGAPAGDKGRALRKAVSMCIDREEYIEKHLNGRGEPADQLVPPGILGRDEKCALANQKLDREAARKLLKDAGFTVVETDAGWVTSLDGKQVTLTVLHRSTRGATKDYATFLTESAAEIGINLDNELMTFAEFLQRQDEGKGQAYDAGWVMDYPDAQNMLQMLYGPNKSPGINSASFSDPAYDKLHREMAGLRDDVPEQAVRKRELIIMLHEVVDRETPWVVMEYRKIFALYHDGYASPPPNPFAYNFRKYERWIR